LHKILLSEISGENYIHQYIRKAGKMLSRSESSAQFARNECSAKNEIGAQVGRNLQKYSSAIFIAKNMEL